MNALIRLKAFPSPVEIPQEFLRTWAFHQTWAPETLPYHARLFDSITSEDLRRYQKHPQADRLSAVADQLEGLRGDYHHPLEFVQDLVNNWEMITQWMSETGHARQQIAYSLVSIGLEVCLKRAQIIHGSPVMVVVDQPNLVLRLPGWEKEVVDDQVVYTCLRDPQIMRECLEVSREIIKSGYQIGLV